MGLGLSKLLGKLIVSCNVNEFGIRKRMIGFENANTFLRRLDKNSMIPILKRNGAKIGNNCDIEAPLIFHNCLDYSNLIIGNNCHIGKNCFFDLRGKVIIEDNVIISMQTTFITHQDVNKSDLRSIYPAKQDNILIKNDSFIGANSTILKGVVVGIFSFVAAGGVVVNNVEPHTLVGGVPAKKIKDLPEA
jgi:acetyltransferase-like isoleucine patch superfamily enzyme